jgi:transcriptional regulator with PAS, ATPase and Fis domain
MRGHFHPIVVSELYGEAMIGVENLPGMIGRHPSMLEAYRLVRKYAPTKLPITIVGETGTGKELVARAIHDLSGPRRPFIDINCAALPESLAEGELFG